MKRPTPTPLRFAIYARYSTDEQGDRSFTTTAAQCAACLRYGQERGWIHVATFTDEGKTGTNLKRPGLSALLACARAQEVDAVLITFMSRLGRGDAFVVARHYLESAKVRVVTVCEEFGEGLTGYAAEAAVRMIDGLYSRMVAEHTRAKMQEIFRKGYHTSGPVRLGYQAVPVDPQEPDSSKRLVPDPQRAPLIREAFTLFCATRSGAAVRELIFQATGERWRFTRIRDMLQSRVYRGEARWGSLVNPAAHEPLVEENLFEVVQHLLETKNLRREKRATAFVSGYPLRSLIVCGCGSSMSPTCATSKTGRRVPYYECLRHRRLGGCTIRRINAQRLHEALTQEIGALAAHPWRVRRLLEQVAQAEADPAQARRAYDAATRRVERLEIQSSKIARGLAAAADSPAAVAILAREAQKVSVELLEAQSAQEMARREYGRVRGARPSVESLSGTLSLFARLYQGASEEVREEMMGLMIERVEVLSPTRAAVKMLSDFVVLSSAGSGSLETRDHNHAHPERPTVPFTITLTGRHPR